MTPRPASPALLLACACGGEVAGAPETTTGMMTTGSPTSFPATDPGHVPTTTADPDTGTSAGTTASPGTTSTTGDDTGTTAGPAVCGDGLVGPGETCDDGPANDNHAACTADCQLNTCGDGHVFVGVEGCDDGAENLDSSYCRSDCQLNTCGDGHLFAGVEECDAGADDNSPTNYNGCDEQCTINRCGDGQLDVPHEACDDGDLNGTDAGDGEIAGCDLDCGFMGRRLWLSSWLFTGDMGGTPGANFACRGMAEDAGLPHPEAYRAVLGDASGSLLLTFLGSDELPVITPAGLVLAPSIAALVDLGPDHGIITTETGEMLEDKFVWTNLGVSGDVYQDDPAKTCDDWTSDDPASTARVGVNAVGPDQFMQWRDGRHWVSFAMKACVKKYRIYCLEL